MSETGAESCGEDCAPCHAKLCFLAQTTGLVGNAPGKCQRILVWPECVHLCWWNIMRHNWLDCAGQLCCLRRPLIHIFTSSSLLLRRYLIYSHLNLSEHKPKRWCVLPSSPHYLVRTSPSTHPARSRSRIGQLPSLIAGPMRGEILTFLYFVFLSFVLHTLVFSSSFFLSSCVSLCAAVALSYCNAFMFYYYR